MVFGYPGIAVPSKQEIHVTWKEDRAEKEMSIESGEDIAHPLWIACINRIIRLCEKKAERRFRGTLWIVNDIPAGKGMGSSTALVIALAKCLLGEECRAEALEIETKMNPGHSGMDFAVIWENRPIVFQKGKEIIDAPIDMDWLTRSTLIDTGTPNEPTPVLVAWIQSRSSDPQIADALQTIGNCTNRLIDGEDPMNIIRDHHRAQVRLGVVPKATQTLIAKIEKSGGAAKVIGAGGRTGGGGMILALIRPPEADTFSTCGEGGHRI